MMRLYRLYLRKFDSDEGRTCDFVLETIALKTELDNIPLYEFMTAARSSDIGALFMRRMTDSTLVIVNVRGNHVSRIKVSLLQDVHFSAFVLEPGQTPENDAPYLMRLHGHMCADAREYSRSNESYFRRELLCRYKLIRYYWDTEELTAQGQMFQSNVSQFPLVWWTSLADEQFRDIQEFAMRTLSCAPSSCAAERSFSVQNRIRINARNCILADKVRKLVSCHWIGKIYNRDDSNRDNFELSILTGQELEIEGVDSTAAVI